MFAGPSRRTGAWEPLAYIYSGVAVHSYRPAISPPASPTTTVQSFPSPVAATTTGGPSASSRAGTLSWSSRQSRSQSTANPAGLELGPSSHGNPHEVNLDVGDEFFAFEQYRSAPEEDGSVWYRGYVVQGVSLAMLMPPSSSPGQFPIAEPSVLIGIFPASAVHVRPNAMTESDVLVAAHEHARQLAEDRLREARREMAAVREEDEDDGFVDDGRRDSINRAVSPQASDEESRFSPSLKPRDITPTDQPSSSVIKRSQRPAALLLTKQPREKDQPPLPTLTAGDSTAAGQQYPLVDEIACALREWYARLPTYLTSREYRLFNAVVQHIDALYLGRRQLLSQMLSFDELVRIRRECVSRLVKCNVAQGLEVIVRSLEDGSVVGVDRDKALTPSGWMSGVMAYVYQVQFAYIDLVPMDALFGKTSIPRPLDTIRAPVAFAFEAARAAELTSPSGYHLMLDFRAFVASPCSPGETAELFFSLYSKLEGKFITEEFCLVLNHLGSPARDAEHRLGKLRTLFAELKADDVIPGTYLVCRIVRNGSMKMAAEASSVDYRGSSTVKRSSGIFIDPLGVRKWRSSVSINSATDDSLSINSGIEPHRTGTINTTRSIVTATGRGSLRRPLGCAILELPALSRISSEGQGEDYVMPIYVARDEATFSTLHVDIILRHERAYERTSRAEGIAFGLRMFHGPAEQVIREHPSLLLDTPQTARLGFPDVVQPGTMRNDLYIKLWAASFSTIFQAGSSLRVRKSVAPMAASTQVSLEVRRGDGTLVADSLYAGGSGEPPTAQYNSIVYYHNDKPTFGELLKVALPQGSGDCHLYLSFRHRSRERLSAEATHDLERPFAFAYLPLFTRNASIKDGKHELVLYLLDKGAAPSPNMYFSVPPTGDQASLGSSQTNGLTALRDRISLRTFLCSTLHTQDDTLRSLFAWQNADAVQLCQTLQLFGFVGEDEIAKFLQPVLDSLFAILVSHLGDRREEVDDLVLKGLIKVLSMSHDRRFPSFESTLVAYTSKHFAFASAAAHLLRGMKAVMARPASKEYRSLLKVWHHIFRFAIRSRELDRTRTSRATINGSPTQVETDFKLQTKDILGDINDIMMSTDKTLIGSQTLAVQHYADILGDLAQVFSPIEIAQMVTKFTDTLSTAKGSLAVYKLLLILQVVKNVLQSAGTRSLLIPAIIRWVKPHLGRFEEELYSARSETTALKDSRRIKWLECNRLAVSVIAWTVNKLQEWLASPFVKSDPKLLAQEEDNLEYCLGILPSLLVSYKELASESTMSLLQRHRTSSSVWKTTPDVFPASHPFALVADLPPPSLVDGQSEEFPPAGIFKFGLAEVAVVIFTLILAAPRIILVRWLEDILELGGVDTLSTTLKEIFDFSSSIIRFEAFPRQWLTLSLLSFTGIVRLVDPIADILSKETFVPPLQLVDKFDIDLWTRCLELMCDLCASEELALEDQSLQRRRAGWIIAGDLRDEGTALLQRLWNTIGWQAVGRSDQSHRYGGYQTRFTGLAQRVLTLCLSTHERLCEVAVDILFSMIYAEYVLDGKFNALQTEIFAKLELLFTQKSASAGESAMRAYFVTRLRAVFEATPDIDAHFRSHVGSFLNEVELFIDLLMAVRDLPETAEWKDERAAATVRLMDFFRRVGRNDLYVRFIHHLVAINIESKDWLGAGLAIKLHAEMFSWRADGELVDEFEQGNVRLPTQTQFERKEALLYHSLDYLVEAEAYECAAEICQELAIQHKNITFDVTRVSELLTHEAKLWGQIGSSSRPKPEYFRVAYYGAITPLNDGKEFIVRGSPWQRYHDFCEALQTKHPSATIYRSKIPPPDHVRNAADPFIWVTSVTPVPDLSRPVFREGVSSPAQLYFRANSVKQFETLRPYVVDPDEREPVLQWLEKSTLTTEVELPSLQSRSEVVSIRHEHISPLDSAVATVRKADRELRKLTNADPIDVKMLGTALNGAVDSRVNGGIPVYKRAFLNPTYLERHPNETKRVGLLRDAVLEYVRVIQQGLVVHQHASRDIAFHEALRTLFAKTYSDEIAALPRSSESSGQSLPSIPPAPPPKTDSIFTTPSKQKSSSKMAHAAPKSPTKLTDSGSSKYVLPPLRLGPRTGVATSDVVLNGSVFAGSPVSASFTSPRTPTTALPLSTLPARDISLKMNGRTVGDNVDNSPLKEGGDTSTVLSPAKATPTLSRNSTSLSRSAAFTSSFTVTNGLKTTEAGAGELGIGADTSRLNGTSRRDTLKRFGSVLRGGRS